MTVLTISFSQFILPKDMNFGGFRRNAVGATRVS